MHPRIGLLSFFVCLALWTMQAEGGDAPPAGSPRRTDRYGDPLPPGVVARLGTERLTLSRPWILIFSPDGRYLAAHDGAKEFRVWDAASGKVLLRLTTPDFASFSTLRPFAFSPDSKAIALACADEKKRPQRLGMVRIWEVASGKELHYFGGLQGGGLNLVFSPDGRYLFGGGNQSPLLRWDLKAGGAPKQYGNFYSVAFLAISRDGKALTADTRERGDGRKCTFIRWNAATGKEIGRHALKIAGQWVGALSCDGGVFAAPDSEGKSIALLDPLTGRELARARGADCPVFISFSADGTTMTCTSKEGNVRIWDTVTGKMRVRFKALSTRIDCIALSADGKRAALAGRADDAVHVCDTAAGRELHSFAGHRGGPLTVAFLNDGKEIATVSRSHSHVTPVTEWEEWSLRRWDAATGAELAATRANPKGEVHFTAFSPDGRQLATVVHDGALHLWDVPSGKELRSWKVPTWESTLKWTWIDGKVVKKPSKMPHPAITRPAFSPDGKMILAARGNKIHRWEAATGRELPVFEIAKISREERLEHSWCLPSPDGRTLALLGVIDHSPPIILLDAGDGKVKQRLKTALKQWRQLAFSADGRTAAVSGIEEVTLWEVASGQPRGRLRGLRWAFSLAFSPDGRFLAAGADKDSPMSLWDLATGRIVGRLQEDCGEVNQVAFSPDGSRLAVAGYSPTVLVCDVAELCGKKKIEEIVKITVPSAEQLEGLWAELSGADGARAYRAIRQLGRAGPRAVALLKRRLKGDKPPNEKRIAQLIADLDDDKFAMREKASEELAQLGVRAAPALRRTLKGDVSAEVRVRIKRLLEGVDAARGPLPSAELVQLRAVEALEANGSKEARQALAELADGPADATLTQEAKASLARLRSRQVKP